MGIAIAKRGLGLVYGGGGIGLMRELADGFLALPGGYGTLEEFCEVLTWGQLGLHRKPCGLLNVEGYFDRLLAQLDHFVAEGFLSRTNRTLVLTEAEPDGLLDAMMSYQSPVRERWIEKEET